MLWAPSRFKLPVSANWSLIWWFFVLDFCRIKHANIVSLEEIFESKSHLYLVMQLWVFVCGLVGFSRSFCATSFSLPHIACHMPVTACCWCIRHLLVDAGETNTPLCPHQWGKSAWKLPTHLRSDRNVRKKGESGTRRAINGNTYPFVTLHRKPGRLNKEGEEQYTRNHLLSLRACVCVCACVRACVRDPQLGIGCGFDTNKRKVYVEKCLLLVVDENNQVSQLKCTR